MRQRKLAVTLPCILLLLYAGSAFVQAFNSEDGMLTTDYYHVVPDADKQTLSPSNMWVISLSDFKRQMRLLKKDGYHNVTLEDVYTWKMGKRDLDEESIAITLDGGSYSTTKFAQPVLKRYGFAGSVFVIGSVTDEQRGPYDPELHQHASHAGIQDERVLQYFSYSYDLRHKNASDFRIDQLNDEQL